jgi:type IV secretory pathway VirB6-like protein
MPFKPKAKTCRYEGCSVIVESDDFNGYCSKKHWDQARLQEIDPTVVRPMPLTSVPIHSVGNEWRRNNRLGLRRGYDYSHSYDKVYFFFFYKIKMFISIVIIIIIIIITIIIIIITITIIITIIIIIAIIAIITNVKACRRQIATRHLPRDE